MNTGTLFVINAGTYPFDIVFYFGQNRTFLINRIKANLNDEDIKILQEYDLRSGIHSRLESNAHLIWLPQKPDSIFWLSILVHEIWHCVDDLFRFIGIKLSDDSTEAYAYLIQYLTDQALRKLKIKIS